MGLLSFGMLLNTEHSTNILEKGPAADSVQATEFRRFWGNKAELRRFQDGSLCEAVIWHGDSLFEKRLITEKIVKHLLQLHADIPESSVNYVGGLLDRILQVGRKLCRTGEEESMKITHAFDDLNRKLWNLEGLPLTITSVQAAHSSLRHTQVFPPLPMNLDLSFFQKEKLDNSLLPLEEKPCPAYIPAFQVICHMEGSGKWPQKKEAIRRIKAAFHIRLAELLRQQYGLICRPAVNALDVYKDGFVFRVQVAYHRESHFLKEGLTSDGMVHYCNAKEALKLELETVHMPLLTNVLNGLQQQHSTFGTTARLAKRWIGAHLLDACLMSDEAVELLVASLFLHPAPFNTPNSPQVGFIRFLLLLSSFDWKNNPLIVNFNGEFSDAEYTEIKNYFVSTRSNLPAMFIATPQDKKNSVWTRESPSVQILQRLIMLASESILVLERQLSTPCSFQDMKVVFRSPLNIYDVLIHLNPKRVPRQAQAIDMPTVTFSRGALFSEAAGTKAFMPIVEFDPVSIYLKELRDAFGELALFFCDPNGGLIIAVLWKPQAFSKQTFRASHMNARLVEIGSNGAQTVPNVEAILEDFEILGAGLVEKLEIQTEKWSI
ncbi:nucleolar protein 6-like [Erpetoichthys calabaricus]|uniref:nucleolar protein 6-like n=1 Tax=Erpetoichthys calabaricus TaxID=27687 RepID=UPI0022342F82|nr:nucleolar protein 6-like [Erpetoichthys calabaricus]